MRRRACERGDDDDAAERVTGEDEFFSLFAVAPLFLAASTADVKLKHGDSKKLGRERDRERFY